MTDLDELMSRLPTDLSPDDIDEIIKYHRAQRAKRAAGEKITKPKSASHIDLTSITQKLITKPETTKLVRRV